MESLESANTIAVAGGQWFHVADWQATGRDMLQLPLTIDNPTGSFFTVTIPLDSPAQTNLVSAKIQLLTP